MTGAVRDEIVGSARYVDRALRAVEDGVHSIRQKLLARRLARTLPPEEWTPTRTHEPGLTADDLRRHATEIRSNRRG